MAKQDRLANFRLSVRGWAFADTKGMRSRLAAGEMEQKLMADIWARDEATEAEQTLVAIRQAIAHEESKQFWKQRRKGGK